jgi:hypothetical protein
MGRACSKHGRNAHTILIQENCREEPDRRPTCTMEGNKIRIDLVETGWKV